MKIVFLNVQIVNILCLKKMYIGNFIILEKLEMLQKIIYEWCMFINTLYK